MAMISPQSIQCGNECQNAMVQGLKQSFSSATIDSCCPFPVDTSVLQPRRPRRVIKARSSLIFQNIPSAWPSPLRLIRLLPTQQKKQTFESMNRHFLRPPMPVQSPVPTSLNRLVSLGRIERGIQTTRPDSGHLLTGQAGHHC